jgi:hypothetical protein
VAEATAERPRVKSRNGVFSTSWILAGFYGCSPQLELEYSGAECGGDQVRFRAEILGLHEVQRPRVSRSVVIVLILATEVPAGRGGRKVEAGDVVEADGLVGRIDDSDRQPSAVF